MIISGYKISKKSTDSDCLRINHGKKSASATLSVIAFIDKDTKQHVAYIPSFKISAYGETIKKANEMLKECLQYYFESLLELSSKALHAELIKYGWEQRKLNHKEYSQAYVDVQGELKNFNAQDDKIERLTLQTA